MDQEPASVVEHLGRSQPVVEGKPRFDPTSQIGSGFEGCEKALQRAGSVATGGEEIFRYLQKHRAIVVVPRGKKIRAGHPNGFNKQGPCALQGPPDLCRPLSPHCARSDFEILWCDRGRVHVAAAVDEVVGLVHQNDMASTALGEMPLQAGGGIEGMVEVADDDVAPGRGVEGKLEGANCVLPRDRLHNFAVEGFVFQKLAQRRPDAVVVAHGIGANARIAAGRILRKANPVFSRQSERPQPRSRPPEMPHRLRRRDSAGGFCREKKDFPLAQEREGLGCWEECGHGFSETRRSLDEEMAAVSDGAVNAAR